MCRQALQARALLGVSAQTPVLPSVAQQGGVVLRSTHLGVVDLYSSGGLRCAAAERHAACMLLRDQLLHCFLGSWLLCCCAELIIVARLVPGGGPPLTQAFLYHHSF